MIERANMTPEDVEEGSRLALDFGKLRRAVAGGEGLVPVARAWCRWRCRTPTAARC